MIPETVQQEKNVNTFRVYKEYFGTDKILLPSTNNAKFKD